MQLLHAYFMYHVWRDNKVGLLLAGSRAISVWGPNLVQQPVSYLPVKSCLLYDWGYRVNESIVPAIQHGCRAKPL